MVSKDEKVYMELVFVRENSISRQKKVKGFWQFLDEQHNLQPHKSISKDGLSKTASPILSLQETLEKDIWSRGLEVFQQFGLDKIAFAADNRCKLCLVEPTFQCEDFADTVTQSYEELNADIKAFEQRTQKSHNLNDSYKMSYADSTNYANTEKS